MFFYLLFREGKKINLGFGIYGSRNINSGILFLDLCISAMHAKPHMLKDYLDISINVKARWHLPQILLSCFCLYCSRKTLWNVYDINYLKWITTIALSSLLYCK